MTATRSNVIPIDRRPVYSHHDPNELAPEFEAHVARCCARSPDFWSRLGHAIDPKALGTEAAKLIVDAVKSITKSSNGRPPTHPDAVLQELAGQSYAGKVTAAQISEVRAMLTASGPTETEVRDQFLPVLRQRARQQAIKLSITEHPKLGGNFAYVRALFERSERLGELTSDPERPLGLGIDELWELASVAPDYLLPQYGIGPGAITILGGYGDSGKSLLAQELMVCVTAGLPAWGGFRIEQGACAWVDYESNGGRLWAHRLKRIAAAHALDKADLTSVAFLPKGPPLSSPDAADWLQRVCAGRKLVVLDSLRMALPSADENSSEIQAQLDPANRVSEETGCSIVVLHHAVKTTLDGSRGKFALRGSGAIFAAGTTVLRIEGEEGARELHHDKARSTGIKEPVRDLAIENVLVDGDPKGGLSVRVLDSAAGVTTAQAATQQAVLGVLAATPGLTVREIQSAVGGRNDGSTGLVVKQLAATGVIVDRGTQRKPAWHVAGGSTP